MMVDAKEHSEWYISILFILLIITHFKFGITIWFAIVYGWLYWNIPLAVSDVLVDDQEIYLVIYICEW